jgi:hypothetical protein
VTACTHPIDDDTPKREQVHTIGQVTIVTQYARCGACRCQVFRTITTRPHQPEHRTRWAMFTPSRVKPKAPYS